jgi:hypothetical protein
MPQGKKKALSSDTRVRRAKSVIKGLREREPAIRAAASNRSTGDRHVLKARSAALEHVEDLLAGRRSA